jgi:hypothetical protein
MDKWRETTPAPVSLGDVSVLGRYLMLREVNSHRPLGRVAELTHQRISRHGSELRARPDTRCPVAVTNPARELDTTCPGKMGSDDTQRK